ncbi:hypothetical protein ACFL3V_07275 [Nanoarchaeota archaeon]
MDRLKRIAEKVMKGSRNAELVLADALMEMGDRRGELIVLHHQREKDPGNEELAGQHAHLTAGLAEDFMESHPELALSTLQWEYGFPTRAIVKNYGTDLGDILDFVQSPDAMIDSLLLKTIELRDENVNCFASVAPHFYEVELFPQNESACRRVCDILVESPHVPGLNILNIRDGEMDSSNREKLAYAEVFKGLDTLKINQSNISNEGAEAIAGSPFVRGLKKLYLESNEIYDPGAIAIAQSENLKGLEVLSLLGNHAGYPTARAFASSNFPDLSLLDVSGNRMTRQGELEMEGHLEGVLISFHYLTHLDRSVEYRKRVAQRDDI